MELFVAQGIKTGDSLVTFVEMVESAAERQCPPKPRLDRQTEEQAM